MRLKAGAKGIIILGIVGIIGYGANWAMQHGYFNTKPTVAASVPTGIDIPTAASSPVGPAGVPMTSQVSLAPAATTGYPIKVLTIAWNGMISLLHANGDADTAANSPMAKRGVRVKVERQDDYSQMLAQQVAFAKQVSQGVAKPSDGAAFVIIMGDGYPAYIAGAQEALSKLGQQLEVVGSFGYSRGEDKCMLPAVAKADPQKARGSLIGGVLRDGDIHICFKWAADNGIPINPDEKTYDPDAMNFVAVNTFTEADEKLIAGYCEERPVVKAGKLTGEKRKVCQNGTATWTPGDVKVAREKGGVVAVASTKEYMWQMPSILIGNKQWMAANPTTVTNLLAAALESGELVRSNDNELMKAATIAAKVFNEETPVYWAKYYKGVTEQDKMGQLVSLGGSTSSGLGDNAFLFGLNGNDNLFKRVYNVYGNMDSKYYPDVLPKLVPYDQVVNTTYLKALLSKSTATIAADTPKFTEAAPTTGTFAKKSYSIEFESGKATFTGTASQTLDDLLDQVAVSGLIVQLNGHTDNVGNPEANLALSKKRAEAIKAWVTANAPSNFPAERVRTRGYGDTTPLADNKTAEGRAKNRRVEVLLLTTN